MMRDPRPPADEAVEDRASPTRIARAPDAQRERRPCDRGGAGGAARAGRAWAGSGRRRGAAGAARRAARRAGARRLAGGDAGGGRHAGSPRASVLRASGRTARGGWRRLRRAWAPRRGGVSSSASGTRPQAHTGRSGGQMQPRALAARKRFTRRSSSEWKEIPANRPSYAQQRPSAAGSAASSWPSSSLTAMRMAWKTRLAGCPAAKRAGRRHRGGHDLDELVGRLAAARGARADDRAGDGPRVALLAVVAQQRREAALVPGVDHVGGGELVVGVHAHVQRGVVGVGEAALARVDLHRGHAEVEVDEVGARRPRRAAARAPRRTARG